MRSARASVGAGVSFLTRTEKVGTFRRIDHWLQRPVACFIKGGGWGRKRVHWSREALLCGMECETARKSEYVKLTGFLSRQSVNVCLGHQVEYDPGCCGNKLQDRPELR